MTQRMAQDDSPAADPLVECQLCHGFKEFGHLDPDNLRWYCEDCWRSFSGEQRTCFLCRRFESRGAVDRSDKRWYCNGCWERYVMEPRADNKPNSATAHGPGRGSQGDRRSRSRHRPSTNQVVSSGAMLDGPSPRFASDSWRAPPVGDRVPRVILVERRPLPHELRRGNPPQRPCSEQHEHRLPVFGRDSRNPPPSSLQGPCPPGFHGLPPAQNIGPRMPAAFNHEIVAAEQRAQPWAFGARTHPHDGARMGVPRGNPHPRMGLPQVPPPGALLGPCR